MSVAILERACRMDGCDGSAIAHGLCDRHYQRLRRWGDPFYEGDPVTPRRPRAKCEVDGCGRDAQARRLCTTHYARWWTTGGTELADAPTRPRSYQLTAAGYAALATPPHKLRPRTRAVESTQVRTVAFMQALNFPQPIARQLAEAGYGLVKRAEPTETMAARASA